MPRPNPSPCRRVGCVIDNAPGTGGMRAMGAAIERPIGFDAVSDDLAPAVVADRRELVNRALEAVERVRFASRDHLEREMIVVAAHFAFRHWDSRRCVPRLHNKLYAAVSHPWLSALRPDKFAA